MGVLLMQHRPGLWLVLLLAGILSGTTVTARDNSLYHCPRLHNPQFRHLAPMTQGKEGWFFRSSEFISHYELLPETLNYLKRLTQAFSSQHARLILLQVPPRILAASDFLNDNQPMQNVFNPKLAAYSYLSYLEKLRQTNAIIVSPLKKAQFYDAKTGSYFYFKRDFHWTPFGAKLTAEYLASVLKQQPDYLDLKTESYTIKKIDEIEFAAKMAEELNALCDTPLPAEKLSLYDITLDSTAPGSGGLFGDDDNTVPLVLLGSSFSDSDKLNFEGFLAFETGLEVANYAITGGELFNSLLSYASLPADKKPKPTFVIWENLAHYDINLGEHMFRQIIPAVYGECSLDNTITHSAISLTKNNSASGNSKLVKLPANSNIHGSGYYLFLHSTNPAFNRFTVEFNYADGDTEWFPIDQRSNFIHTGRFFIELNDEIHAPLTEITIKDINKNTPSQLEARLCKFANFKESP